MDFDLQTQILDSALLTSDLSLSMISIKVIFNANCLFKMFVVLFLSMILFIKFPDLRDAGLLGGAELKV